MPVCVGRTLQAYEGPEPAPLLPAPQVSPKTGIIGARVTVAGNGAAPRSTLVVIGAFAGHNCEIDGVLGATNLAGTISDGNGAYVSTFDWSPEFTSDLYPSASGVRSPAGRYYILVFRCGDPTCSPPYPQGSLAFGPFMLTAHLPAIPAGTPICVKSQVRVTYDEPTSEATGQHTTRFLVQNIGTRECVLVGYPDIELDDTHGRPIPFVYRDHGDQMLTNARPTRVGLTPKGFAYFAINKYRCDRGGIEAAAVTGITLPGEADPFRLKGGADYCGSGDPGSVIDITPIEPTALAETSL